MERDADVRAVAIVTFDRVHLRWTHEGLRWTTVCESAWMSVRLQRGRGR